MSRRWMSRLRCPRCDAKIPDFHSYCPNCGLVLQVEYCPHCREQQIFSSSGQCLRCGFRPSVLTPSPLQPLPPPPPPPPEIQSGESADISASVQRGFRILEAITEPGYLSFSVADDFSKGSFETLVKDLDKKGYIPFLRRREGKTIITIGKIPPQRQSTGRFSNIMGMKRIWVWLFVATCLTVLLSGYFMSVGLAEKNLLYSSVVVSTLSFMVSMIAIFGVHELGHKVACLIHKSESTPPFFVPGPPPLGTFGAVIFQSKPLINRDELFDLGFSGPLAGLVVAAVVSAIGLRLSAITSVTTEGLETIPSPLFFELIGSLVSPNVPRGYILVLSPIAYAGWAGFLLTYLQLLPVWQLDGAHVTYAVFGRRFQKFLWIIGLILMFFSGFLLMAILIMMFMTMQRSVHPELLDEVSPLSSSRKVLYSLVLIATIGCMTISAF
jgi:hypothetical protein